MQRDFQLKATISYQMASAFEAWDISLCFLIFFKGESGGEGWLEGANEKVRGVTQAQSGSQMRVQKIRDRSCNISWLAAAG